MIAKIDAFLTEVRNMPGFVIASAVWNRELDGIERGLIAVDRRANEDHPAFLDILDNMQAVVGRAGLSTKEKLLEIGKLLVQLRAVMKIIH